MQQSPSSGTNNSSVSRNMPPHVRESKYSLPHSQELPTVSDMTQTKHNVELTEALSIKKYQEF